MIARTGLSSITQLSSLPPTSSSAKMCSFCVYLQVQSWYGNDLNPLDFGWELRGGSLLPISSECAAAPERLLTMIYCDCKAGCKENSTCRCRKANEACNAGTVLVCLVQMCLMRTWNMNKFNPLSS